MTKSIKQSMRIVRLNIENVMRIKTAEITPTSSMVVLSGENDQGKTSIIDSISMAIGGKKAIPDRPLRDGEEKGFIETDLGNLIITRRFTKKNQAKGGALTIKSKDGSKYGQQILEELYSSVCFDPEEFMRKKNKVEILKEITGLDFTDIDNDRAEKYNNRQDINRQVKELKAVIGDKQILKAPDEELSLQELMDEQKRRENVNEENEAQGTILNDLQVDLNFAEESKKLVQEEIKNLNAKIMQFDKDIEEISTKQKAQHKVVLDLVDLDVEEVQGQMLKIEETNRMVRHNTELSENRAKLKTLEASSEQETNAIHKIDVDKLGMLEAARMPIAGLTFDNDQVFYQGIPIEQLSDSDEIRVSMAIAMAMNPFIRVILIRKGSLIDRKKRIVIKEMAEEYGYQVWIELVDEEQGTIIIHDGEIASQPAGV